jgi:hypothetical protein
MALSILINSADSHCVACGNDAVHNEDVLYPGILEKKKEA